MTHFPVQQTSEHVTPLSSLTSGGSGVTVLNGNVGILQLELPKSQQEALESPNTAFTSVNPDFVGSWVDVMARYKAGPVRAKCRIQIIIKSLQF